MPGSLTEPGNPNFTATQRLSLVSPLFAALRTQVVRYREDARHVSGSYVSESRVRLIRHYAFQRHMTAFDDDMYGGICSQRITIETARAENRAIGANPDFIVKRRERQ